MPYKHWPKHSLVVFFTSHTNPSHELTRYYYLGANMVECTKLVLWNTKTIYLLVKGPKVVAKCSLNCFVFHDGLYCCVRYSSVDYQVEILKTYHQRVMLKSTWSNIGSNINSWPQIFLKLEIFHILCIHCILEVIITKLDRKPLMNVILLYLKQI
jgi:hypothetical protein